MEREVGELKYIPQNTIGRGSSGTFVFRGLHLGSRPVAIKRIHREYGKDKSSRQIREVEIMKIMKAKDHPNILHLIHTEINEDFLYIAMELCRGTLEEYVEGKFNGPKFESEKEILLQITQGLAHLHKEKICHRDINPTNILISAPDGTGTNPIMKLADFGISKMLKLDENDFLNTSVGLSPNGRPGWMPPEVYTSDRFNFKVDVWALGCIFFYTLCKGKHPYGEDIFKRLDLIRKGKPTDIKNNMKRPYKQDHQAFAVIKSMLRTDPSKRPTVEDVLKHPFFIPDENRMNYFEQLWIEFKYSVTSDLTVQLEEMLWEIDMGEKMDSENTPLHILCRHYKNDDLKDLVIFLIKKGADVNAENESGETPLHLLCSYYEKDNVKDIVQLLISNGADFTAKTNNLRNPLYYLCRNKFESNQNLNRKDVFQFLMGSGADVNAKDKDGWTPLHLLYKMNDKNNDLEDIANYLFEIHLNVDTSLHFLYSRFKTEKEIRELSYNPHVIIGRGAFGTVYSGFYSQSTPVAVKQIQLSRVTEDDVKKEVELMIKAKDHPNILRYIYHEKDDDFLYIATELCRGTLQQYINGKIYTEPRFPSEREILFQITQGLAHLHRLNIVHRDIKPNNILIYMAPLSNESTDVESNSQVKLADFGRCKNIDEDFTNTSKTNPNGTKGWIAPELYQNKRGDSKVDIFALGLIFGYTLSGGKHPFGDDPDDRVVRIKKKKPMKMARNDLKNPYSSESDEVFDLFKCMLMMNPDERPTVQKIVTSLFFSANRHKLFESICSSFEKCVTADGIAKFENLLKDDLIDVNAKLESGYTPLHTSCQYCGNNNLIDVIRFLVIEKRANVNAKDKFEETPLHILCQNYKNENLIDIARFLMENKAEVNAKNKDGWTPLISLCYNYKNYNLIDIVQLFLQKGGEVDTSDTNGFTPLHWLCRNYGNDNLIGIIQLLVEKGANVNEKNKYEQTPLHYVCRYYNNQNLKDIVQFLMSEGARANAKNQEGGTPLHLLCRYYKIEDAIKEEENMKSLVSLFEEHGVSMGEKDNVGMTPNDYLIRRKETDGTRESTDIAVDVLNFNC